MSHALKSRFMPYLNAIEQPASSPFALSEPTAHVPVQEVLGRDPSSMTLGMSAGSTITAPCAFSTAIASSIDLLLRVAQPAARLSLPPVVTLS